MFFLTTFLQLQPFPIVDLAKLRPFLLWGAYSLVSFRIELMLLPKIEGFVRLPTTGTGSWEFQV